LLAVGVFVLVLLFSVLILVCVALKHSRLPLAGHEATSWGGCWNERWDAGPSEPYQDDCFFDTVDRGSVSIATGFGKQLTNLKQPVVLNMPNCDTIPAEQITGESCYIPTQKTEEPDASSPGLMMDDNGLNWHALPDSPTSSTGRSREVGTVTKRPERVASHNDSCDLEAQDSNNHAH
jgi:hypothetical protein